MLPKTIPRTIQKQSCTMTSVAFTLITLYCAMCFKFDDKLVRWHLIKSLLKIHVHHINIINSLTSSKSSFKLAKPDLPSTSLCSPVLMNSFSFRWLSSLIQINVSKQFLPLKTASSCWVCSYSLLCTSKWPLLTSVSGTITMSTLHVSEPLILPQNPRFHPIWSRWHPDFQFCQISLNLHAINYISCWGLQNFI